MLRSSLKALHTVATVLLATLLTLTGCQTPVTVAATSPRGPTFGLSALALADTLAAKPNHNWHDNLLNFPPLLERLKARSYKTQGVGAGSVAWSKSFAPISSAPCYLKADANAWNTQAADRVAIVTDGGTVALLDPATGNTVLSAPTGGSFSKTAVEVSGDNQRLYLLTKDGKLLIVRLSDLAVIKTVTLNASATAFVGLAPFLDYGDGLSGGNTNFGSIERLYAVAQDGTTYRVDIDVNPSPMTVTTKSYATALAGATVVANPVAWRDQLFWGTSTGTFYQINYTNAAAPSRTSWALSGYTSASGNGAGVNAPAAFAYDANFDVNALFVPCGDRVDWIDLPTGIVTSSPSLTLDAIPASPAGKLSSYSPAAPVTVAATNAADWCAIKAKANPTPTLWGGGSAYPSIQNTIANATSVRVHPFTGDIWVTDETGAKLYRFNSAGAQLGAVTLGTSNNGPIKLEFDGAGYCWVTAGAIPGGGTVAKYQPDGTLVFSKAITGALYIAPERGGAGPYGCWVTDYNGQKLSKLDASGNYTISPFAVSGITTIYTDKNNYCWTTGFINNNNVSKYAPNGAVVSGFPKTVGTNPIFIDFDPVTADAWVTNNSYSSGTPGTTGSITKLVNATGAAAGTQAGLGDHPWSVRFDPSGSPWLTHMNYFGSAPRTLERLTKATGTQEALFSFASIGNPYEMDFESNGTTWVACTPGGLYKILDIGNTQDLMASSYRLIASPPDGDNSYAYLKFKIPLSSYKDASNNRLAVTGSKLKLTAATTPPGGDEVEVHMASSLNPFTGTAWVGYSGTPTVDYANRPITTSDAAADYPSTQYTKDTTYTFDVPTPADQKNSPDTSNALWTFGVRTANKQLRNAVHWYSQTSAAGTVSRYPNLNVTLAGGAYLPTTAGIACQPSVDDLYHKVWVCSCNTLFELDYSSAGAWGSTASTVYNLTSQGRKPAVGTKNTTTKAYTFPTGNALETFRGHLLVEDYNPANGDLVIDNFNCATVGNTADHLSYELDLGAGSGGTAASPLCCWDYDDGGLYMVTSNGNVVRSTIVQ